MTSGCFGGVQGETKENSPMFGRMEIDQANKLTSKLT